MNILYLTWDGEQTSYLESLFLPIFNEIKNQQDVNFSVMQFNWFDEKKRNNILKLCNEHGLDYVPINILRKPKSLGALLTILFNANRLSNYIERNDIQLVIARSTFAVFAAMLALRGNKDVKLLYDADGLQIDERVDFSSLDNSSFIFRYLRDIELRAIVKADSVITRSDMALSILLARGGAGVNSDKFSVVTNGTNLDLFRIDLTGRTAARRKIRAKLGMCFKSPIIIYAGSLGKQYCPDEMLIFFSEIVKAYPNSRFVILSSDHTLIRSSELYARLKNSLILDRVEPKEVANYLHAADLGVCLRDRKYSMQGVAPIKLSEYLISGLPVLATRDIGDTRIVDESCGYLLSDNTEGEILYSAEKFIKRFKEGYFNSDLISKKACALYSLESSARMYLKAINRALND